MQKITPFLWFDNKAEEAAKFYAGIFKNSKITSTSRCGDAGPGPDEVPIRDAEHRGGSGDADAKRQDGRQREPWCFRQRAHGKADVLQHALEARQRPRPMDILARERHAAERTPARARRLPFAQAAALELSLSQRAVRFHLLAEIGVVT